jgi:hypothetical protein
MSSGGNKNKSRSLDVARFWLSQGWKVLPCQHNSKKLVKGFGPNLKQLSELGELELWFKYLHANLAVVAPEDGLILDFDIPEVYDDWARSWPEAAQSYTEQTPRGGCHVFLYSPGWRKFHKASLRGLEVKYSVIVYPSKVGGRSYEIRINDRILTIEADTALKSVLRYQKPTYPTYAPPSPSQGQIGGVLTVIQEVKKKWGILPYLATFEPGLKISGRGRWRSALCPWHEDKSPSLWIDTERGLWGCHACGARGDVINWHALRMGIKSQVKAAQDLAVRIAPLGI